jgi:hypothetical protein
MKRAKCELNELKVCVGFEPLRTLGTHWGSCPVQGHRGGKPPDRVAQLVQVRLAQMIYDNGNGNEHARQEIPYAEFALEKITLYSCWDGEHWVIMLPIE